MLLIKFTSFSWHLIFQVDWLHFEGLCLQSDKSTSGKKLQDAIFEMQGFCNNFYTLCIRIQVIGTSQSKWLLLLIIYGACPENWWTRLGQRQQNFILPRHWVLDSFRHLKLMGSKENCGKSPSRQNFCGCFV